MQLFRRKEKMTPEQIISTLLSFYKLPLKGGEIEKQRWRFWTACDEYRKQPDIKRAIIDLEIFKGLSDA